MRLSFVGDVMLGRLVNEALRKETVIYPWGDTLPLFRRARVAVCNLECVISDKGEKRSATPKAFYFRSDTKNVEVLTAAGIKAVSIANNHALDYGVEALREMQTILTKAGIKFAGAGKSIEEARAAAVWEENGERIGFLAFTDNEPAWGATESRYGTNYAPVELGDPAVRVLVERVKQLRGGVEVLIVSGHWGGNWGYEPPKEHLELAHALVEAGTDIVFGHSAHVCRGVEIYQGKVIMYGAGDFIDDYAVDEAERNDRSMIFGVEGGRGKITAVYFYPTVIRAMQAKMAKGEDQTAIRQKMSQLCRDLGTETRWSETRGRLEVVGL